jgi:hypothetical protein
MRARLRELASVRRRFGYRRFTFCSHADLIQTLKPDRFWLELSAPIPWLGGAESDEGIEIFGRSEGAHSEAGC